MANNTYLFMSFFQKKQGQKRKKDTFEEETPEMKRNKLIKEEDERVRFYHLLHLIQFLFYFVLYLVVQRG